MWRLLLLALLAAAEDNKDKDRTVLGSSVVTSVSVIMDAGNGSKIYTDAVGKPVSKPQVATDVASPIELLNPDRYEFYTFDDAGDLVKRLMTLEEIHDIIATGDDDVTLDAFMPEKRVNDVVNNVQNVLKEEIKQHKNPEKPEFDTPDVSDSWSMILPAIFGNSGADIKPEPPTSHVTPDTVLVMATTEQISTTQKVNTLQTSSTSTTTTSTTSSTPLINVEIITNSNSTTERSDNVSPVVEIKPQHESEFKNNVRKGTKRPFPVKSTTFKPLRRPTRTTTLTEAPSTTTTTTTTPATTTEPVSETIVPDAGAQFEKILPETTTITTVPTTTTPPTTTELDRKTIVPQFEKIALETTTTTEPETTSTEMPSTTKVVPETTTTTTPTTTQQETSTYGTFSTFFLVSDTKNQSEPDLSTLGTEYVTVKTLSTNTTESTVPDLEQFLLTSTNIYEINSQLSDSTTEEKTETTEASEKFLIRLTNPTEVPTTTTDQTFIETIEQLISQAVGTSGPYVEAQKEASMVEEMMKNGGNKTMEEVMAETATAGSSLLDMVPTKVVPTTMDLSESVDSLLSQVLQVSTTLEPETTTVVPTVVPPESHIINITIIRNEPKPAKADLSLEMEYDAMLDEMRKNGTFDDSTMPKNGSLVETTTIDSTMPQNGTLVETTTIDSTTTFDSTTTEETIESSTTPSIEITINEKNESGATWTLVSTLAPPTSTPPAVDLVPKPLQGFGLEDSTAHLDTDIYQFVQLCNELAFGFWKSVTNGLSTARSVVVSPFAATSLLAMVFLGARGATSGEMNEILKLDDMVTFNPHLIFKNVSESIEVGPESGVAVSAIVRELYSDRSKGKLLGFYKERVRQFYDGHVEEASFREIGDVIRRRTNLLVKKHTDGRIGEFLKDGSLVAKPPLAGVSVSIFQTDCSHGSTEGRDGELHFVVLPSLRQRRLIPIPATVYRSGFLAGYEPSLDATAAALGSKDATISTIFIIPGQQGVTAPGDGLSRLEKRLVESSFKKGAWSRLLRSLIPRPGLELQIPRFQHRSLVNATQSLKRMGLHELFDAQKADLKGLNGAAHELYLSDVVQLNEFATCGEGRIGEGHHKEVYPATAERRSLDWEDYQRAFHDPLHDPRYLDLPLAQRPRQARLPETPRLRFDRPFLYFVRHNPSGLILHMGRFHPRLLP
ncbi:mucin-2 isoform X2 [Tribolium castaneum]|uniref:Serpin peptidase inhibitor 2 n=2 Tax=Tribolium castaneum TaxID=7070 RepID=D7EIU9_TRICA|nr:PREDICTED: cell wall protein DAN4 isoform X2 [Tribolium castaneum]EFA12384.1 serpin peptidase inhibitor 2 [Tribolium castaneum]|eukprot:XP_968019.1 PREDICTED: cell wall protein DAN4 isoform X2 [Tribolium castaneum]